jgi:hypothetical protein
MKIAFNVGSGFRPKNEEKPEFRSTLWLCNFNPSIQLMSQSRWLLKIRRLLLTQERWLAREQMSRDNGQCRASLGRFLRSFGASKVIFQAKESIDLDGDNFYSTYALTRRLFARGF